MAEADTGPGTYLLLTEEDGPVHYVGRSDTNLKQRLDSEGWECPNCGIHIKQKKWWNLSSAKQAYEKECQEFHTRKNLCNDIHPDRPNGANYKCPVCGL